MDKKDIIFKDIYEQFGKCCFKTGEEIKNIMSNIYSKHNYKFYPEIKTLEKFGYSLKRFLKDNKFIYEINFIQT